MPAFEYKVVPAPEKGLKGKGIKGTQGRFAYALETVMNDLGARGWEYVRADVLPCEERSGIAGSSTSYMNMLVFRREANAAVSATVQQVAAPKVEPIPPAPAPAAPVETNPTPAPSAATDAAAAAAAAALTAYRDSGKSSAPKLGPAKGDDVAAE